MQLLAVRTARVLAFINAEELNPSGRPLAHDFLNAFVQRYGFLKYPEKPDDFDSSKGLIFELGKFNDIGLDRVALFDWGVAVETSASTDASEGMLEDVLTWGAGGFGLSNRPGLITRRAYVSEIVFSSDMFLPRINPTLQALGHRVTDSIATSFGQNLPYEISGVSFHYDTSQSKQFFPQVRIERLEQSSFSDNKYYSGAPLRTSEHIALIKDFESALEAAKASNANPEEKPK